MIEPSYLCTRTVYKQLQYPLCTSDYDVKVVQDPKIRGKEET